MDDFGNDVAVEATAVVIGAAVEVIRRANPGAETNAAVFELLAEALADVAMEAGAPSIEEAMTEARKVIECRMVAAGYKQETTE